jgi:hypothetical protein
VFLEDFALPLQLLLHQPLRSRQLFAEQPLKVAVSMRQAVNPGRDVGLEELERAGRVFFLGTRKPGIGKSQHGHG